MKSKMGVSTIILFFTTLQYSLLALTMGISPLPRSGPMLVRDPSEPQTPVESSDFDTLYYRQEIDHFNYNPQSYTKFKQKYMINSRYWGGGRSKAPILVYLGAEAPMNPERNFITDISPSFRALILFIEHRFYGDSIPFGLTMEHVVANEDLRGYFNSAQALADYAAVILHVKAKMKAHRSPVIVFGGSYGGMLAAWFRLKYPHVAAGALASSAPLLYFDGITSPYAYYSVVAKDFRETSESCYKTISESWAEINRVASQIHGLSTLTKKFNLCSKLSSPLELKNFLIGKYALAAQYGRPPVYKATAICNAIDAAPKTGNVLDRIFAGLVADYGDGHKGCYNTSEGSDSQTTLGWSWQTCSDLVIPMGTGPNNTMFEPLLYDSSAYNAYCKELYSVAPRLHWVTTYYGGHDIKLILERFGSNIIFSNGLKDPYSIAGVLENISESVIAISTKQGSHCLDLLEANPATDAQWLVVQKRKEVEVIKGWIKQYYADRSH